MTYREVELWILGQEDAAHRVKETLAWMQANLMNVHRGKGPAVRPDKLLKPRKRRQDEPEAEPAPTSLEEVRLRARAIQARQEDEAFKNSAEGRRRAAMVERAGLAVPADED